MPNGASSEPVLASPASIEAERALLGAVLLDSSTLEQVRNLLPEHFSVDAHQRIYKQMRKMAAIGEPIDSLTLADALRRDGEQLHVLGGTEYLAELTTGAVVHNAERHARLVKRDALLRELARVGERLQADASLVGAEPSELLACARLAIDSLQESNSCDGLKAISASSFLALELRPREMILDPIIPAQGLSMIYSRRGTGKTYLALGIAHAVATGQQFLRWVAPQQRHVLYVDGELPGAVLQGRLNAVLGKDSGESSDFLRVITPDLLRGPIPDLATVLGQAMIERELRGAELLILDNLSALVRSGKENEGESWIPVQEWALRLRQRGVSVLFVHHAGKGGTQRGTSRREDLLDVVIALRHPSDYSAQDGLRCEVEFEKIRHFCGDQAKPFEVRMEITAPGGPATWSTKDVEDGQLQRAAELFNEGNSVRDVAEELGISRAKAGRLRKKANETRLLK